MQLEGGWGGGGGGYKIGRRVEIEEVERGCGVKAGGELNSKVQSYST